MINEIVKVKESTELLHLAYINFEHFFALVRSLLQLRRKQLNFFLYGPE